LTEVFRVFFGVIVFLIGFMLFACLPL